VFHVATSILTDVKKVLDIDESYTAFDLDILMHINTAFANLNQLGIGPVDGSGVLLGFEIEDKTTTWDAFITDPRYNGVKTYIYLQVRSWFDPPQTAHHVTAMQRQIDELVSRLSILRESDSWTAPVTPVPDPVTCW
jgi:hypothetical protein